MSSTKNEEIDKHVLKKRLFTLLVIDLIVLFGLSVGVAAVTISVLFLISPLIPFICLPLFRKPYRAIRLSTSNYANGLRIVAGLLVLYLGYMQVPHIFDAMMVHSDSPGAYISALQAPVVNGLLMLLTPLVVFLAIVEASAAGIMLARFSGSDHIDKDFTLSIFQALLLGFAVAMLGFGLFMFLASFPG